MRYSRKNVYVRYLISWWVLVIWWWWWWWWRKPINVVVIKCLKICSMENQRNLALFTGQKRRKFRLLLKLSLLHGSQLKSARTSPLHLAHTVLDVIQIGSVSAELLSNGWMPFFPHRVIVVQLCSSWQDYNWQSVARSICGSWISCVIMLRRDYAINQFHEYVWHVLCFTNNACITDVKPRICLMNLQWRHWDSVCLWRGFYFWA